MPTTTQTPQNSLLQPRNLQKGYPLPSAQINSVLTLLRITTRQIDWALAHETDEPTKQNLINAKARLLDEIDQISSRFTTEPIKQER